MSLVNFNGLFGSNGVSKAQKAEPVSSNKPIFTPAPSVETAGSVASSAPSSGSFSAVC